MKNESQEDFTHALLIARQHGKEAIQELAEHHLPLVAAMVKRFPWNSHEPEELYQQGCVGLMKALARFDPAYGVTFSTFAAALILGEMRMLCRLDSPVHIPRRDRELRTRIKRAASELTQCLGREPSVQEVASVLRTDPAELMLTMENIHFTSCTSHSGESIISMLPAQDQWLDRVLLRDIIQRLPDEDQRLLLLRYRLGRTQLETARALGTTQVQISRRECAIKKQIQSEWFSDI